MPPKQNTDYTKRDQMANLNRQDKRRETPDPSRSRSPVRTYDSDEMDLIIEDPLELPLGTQAQVAATPSVHPQNDEEDEFLYAAKMLNNFKSTAPKYLTSLIMKLADKYAAIRCSIRNLEHKIFGLSAALDSAATASALPDCLARYRKEIDTIHDVDQKSTRINQLIETTKNGYVTKKTDLISSYNGRHDELRDKMEPFTEIKESLKNSSFDFAYVLNLLIEERVCLMIQKQTEDEKKKQDKKVKLDLLREKNSAVKEISVKEYSQLRRELDQLKRQLHQQKKTPKNVKGNPSTKKGGKPQPGKAKSKPGKNSGGLQGTKGKKK